MNSSRLAVAALLVAALWASPGAYAQDMARGVYVNSQVHFFTVGTDSSHRTVTHNAGAVDTSSWTWASTESQTSADIGACAPTGDIDRDMNAAVFGNTLVLAFVGWKGCDKSTGGTLFVISFDMAAKTFGPLIPLGATKHKGIADCCGNASKDAATAAIVAFDDLLYVFSDSGAYTSGDGVNWTVSPGVTAVVPSGSQPLDAIAYYPPGEDPRILVVLGYGDSNIYDWNWAYAVSWNGKTDATSDVRLLPSFSSLAGDTESVASVGLIAGTAKPASAAGFTAGALKPAIQAIVRGHELYRSMGYAHIRRYEFTYDTPATEGWTADPGKALDQYLQNAFNWFTDDECVGDSRILRQHIVAQYTDFTNSQKGKLTSLTFTSDAMVPENRSTPISCPTPPDPGSWGGEVTDTDPANTDPDTMAALRSYWTLLGVVMGSPPFAVNDASDWEIPELSNVIYSKTDSISMTNTEERENSVLQSSSAKVGIGLKRLSLTPQYSQSYGHAWRSANEKTTTTTTTLVGTFGTNSADPEHPEDLGRFGWALFNIPNYVVQDYALYAYDYSTATQAGTSLGQDIHSVQVSGTPDLKGLAFELENPGGPNDDIPGLMAGIGPFHRSTDLDGWSGGFSDAGTNYSIKWGDGTHGEKTVNSLYMGQNSSTAITISRDDESIVTKGQTNDVDVDAGLGIGVKTKLKGLSLKGGVELSAGYSGSFSSSTTTTTSTGKEVSAQLGIPTCSSPDCIKTLTVQPFWLQATDTSAPWIPPGRDQLPWVLTWQVKNPGCYNDGRQTGNALPMESASGTVVGGTGGMTTRASAEETATVAATSSHFSLTGGKLIWEGRNETLVPIPMTAAKFVAALGASVTLNGYRWASWLHDGAWTRNGKVWTFQSYKSATADVVLLRLDFGQLTWDLDLSKADLSPYVKAGQGAVRVELAVNSKHRFFVDVEPDVATSWDVHLDEVPGAPLSRWLGRYQGSYDPASGAGTATVSGRIPEGSKTFGDLSFAVNGRQVDAPLITHPDYESALALGHELVYEREGLRLAVDFGTKSWSARISGPLFNPLHLPRGGGVKLAVKLGGQLQYQAQVPVKDYTSNLTYRRWKHASVTAGGAVPFQPAPRGN